jgi:DNA-binding MarR family transcriptional regulator
MQRKVRKPSVFDGRYTHLNNMNLLKLVSDTGSAIGAANRLLTAQGLKPISFGDLQTLVLVSEYGTQGMAHIAKLRGVSSAAITGSIDYLESKKLAFREHDSEDRRKVRIKVTELGTQVMAAASAAL